eukprot:6181557-Pleurochrysis_carterae.AAC.1
MCCSARSLHCACSAHLSAHAPLLRVWPCLRLSARRAPLLGRRACIENGSSITCTACPPGACPLPALSSLLRQQN